MIIDGAQQAKRLTVLRLGGVRLSLLHQRHPEVVARSGLRPPVPAALGGQQRDPMAGEPRLDGLDGEEIVAHGVGEAPAVVVEALFQGERAQHRDKVGLAAAPGHGLVLSAE